MPVVHGLGSRIAELRHRRGWTQRDLAKRARVSVPFLSDLENDNTGVGSETLLFLADALGASLDYLLRGKVMPPREPLVIPPGLSEAAEEQGWSLVETKDLLGARDMVVARRAPSETPRRTSEELTKEDETAISKFRERWVARQEQQRVGRWVPQGSTARRLRSGLVEYGDPGALNVQEFARFRWRT